MLSKLRSLASDTVIYGSSTILQRFLTFLLTPLYTNFLSMAELGIVANLYSLIAFVNVVYSFGFESSFLRYYRRDDPQRRAVYTLCYASIVVVALLFSSVSLSMPNLITSYSGLHSEVGIRIGMMATLIPLLDALTLIPFARLRMEHRPKVFAGLKLIVVFINVCANLLFVVSWHWGAEGVFIAGMLSSAVGFVLFIPSILKQIEFRWDKTLFKSLLSFGLPTLPSGFSSIMLQVADRPILLALTDPSTVGLYNANYRLGIPMMLFVSVFEYAWKPFYLTHADDKDAKQLFGKIFSYFSLVSAVLFLVISFFIGTVVQMPFIGGRFIRETYWTGLGIVPIIAASYYFTGVATNFAAGLHITKQTKYLPLSTGAAALANILLNLAFIPVFSYYGAAWATFGAYVISAAVMYYYSSRIYPIDIEWQRVALFLGVALAVYAMSFVISSQNLILSGIIHLALIAVYLVILIAIKAITPEEVRSLKQILLRRKV